MPESTFFSPSIAAPLTFIEVDLDAIVRNLRAIKAHIDPSVQIVAVVKANAYGHGAVAVARAALFAGASCLAVARVMEGVQLRQEGITAPILVLGYTMPAEAIVGVDHNLTLTVTEAHIAEQVSARAVASGRLAAVHVKVDTGMGRFGLLPEEVVPFLRRLAALPGLRLQGIFTHFAAADAADQTYTRRQFAVFQEVLQAAQAAGIAFPLRHAANSAAALSLPETHLDAVRIGLAMYGLRPSAEVEPPVALQPVLTLHSHVARVRVLPAGASIGYGCAYTTPRAMPVALVPVGYGDGYHRVLSNRGSVLINGCRCPILGRVSMDQIVVDVSEAGAVAVEDEVVLIGQQGAARIDAEEVAQLADTINYEVVTALTARVPRLYRTDDPALRAALGR
ncbi:MAG: alanine racemase [Anaerolineae bacterium]|nr:alanine racemase [Anaerolineae bacterium]